MTPHQEVPNVERSYVDRLYNRKLQKWQFLVEHAFGILKQCFCELGVKSDLHVTFLLGVLIVSFYLIHNFLLRQSVDDVELLLKVLQSKGMRLEVRNDQVVDQNANAKSISIHAEVDSKHTNLGAYLANR